MHAWSTFPHVREWQGLNTSLLLHFTENASKEDVQEYLRIRSAVSSATIHMAQFSFWEELKSVERLERQKLLDSEAPAIGTRIRHARRGTGTIVDVLSNDLRHKPFKVNFDNGEVHQYSRDAVAIKLQVISTLKPDGPEQGTAKKVSAFQFNRVIKFVQRRGATRLLRVIWKICKAEAYVSLSNWLVFTASSFETLKLCQLVLNLLSALPGAPKESPNPLQRNDGPSARGFHKMLVLEEMLSVRRWSLKGMCSYGLCSYGVYSYGLYSHGSVRRWSLKGCMDKSVCTFFCRDVHGPVYGHSLEPKQVPNKSGSLLKIPPDISSILHAR